MFALLVIALLLCSALGVTQTSPGSSLAANNPIAQTVVLCSTLFATLVGAQNRFTNEESSDEFDNTIVTNIALDDDDNDFQGGQISQEFEQAPQGFIQFEPRTYASIVGVAVVITLLGLWAAFDFSGGRLTPQRLAAIRTRVNANGGILPWFIWVTPFILGVLIVILELAFLVIATIYVVQPMLQWAVVENPNGTQSVIAQEGLFIVSTAGAGAALVTITPVPIIASNFPPFFFPIEVIGVGTGGIAAPTAGSAPFESPNSELVLSPTPIAVENTYYVYIVFTLLLAQFFVALGNALIWRGGQYIAGAFAIFAGWGLDVAVIVLASLELSDLNPGQESAEEIAVLIFAIFAVVLLFLVLAFAIGVAVILRNVEYGAILSMNDEELASITPTTSTDKRRGN
jgi:hypothetical protein